MAQELAGAKLVLFRHFYPYLNTHYFHLRLQVGSRAVVMMTSVILICLGMLGKFGAFFVMIPDPVIGGVFMILFGEILFQQT